MLDGQVLGASQVEYKPFGKPSKERDKPFGKLPLKREIPGMQGFPEKPCIELPPKFDSESFNTSANTSAICAICVHIPAAPSRGTSTLPGFLAIRA